MGIDRRALRGAAVCGSAYAAPSPVAKACAKDVKSGLGLGTARGALIAGVDDKGPAKPAGLMPGDVIVKFDSKDIKN